MLQPLAWRARVRATLLPFLDWRALLTRANLRNDAFAALTTATVMVPQGVAFAAVAGLPPQYGFYAALVPPIVAALFGSSRHMISGPTAAISALVYSTLSGTFEPGSAEFVSAAVALALLAGVFQLVLGFARMGQLANLASNSVLVGFTTGAALLIVLGQLGAVLDVVLPGVDGFAICREIRRRKVTTPIMMLSARGVTDDRVRGLDSGADDYLTKPFDFAELSARVRALLRRQAPAAALAVTVGDLRLDPVTRTIHRGARTVDLTQKEFALLEYFMRNPDYILTRAMIGEHVWHFTWDRMTNVIDVYVNHLRRKLEESGEPRLIHAVRGVGYVLRSNGAPDDPDTQGT